MVFTKQQIFQHKADLHTRFFEYFLKTTNNDPNSLFAIKFQEVLDRHLDTFLLEKYQPPKENPNWHTFDLFLDLAHNYRRSGYYDRMVARARKQYQTKQVQFEENVTALLSDEEALAGHEGIKASTIEDPNNPEEMVMNSYITDRIYSTIKEFAKYLTPYEREYLIPMQKEITYKEMVERLNQLGYEKNMDHVRFVWNSIKYRLTCFFALSRNRIMIDQIILKALNNDPKARKRLLGIKEKLTEIPDDEVLMEGVKALRVKKDTPTADLGPAIQAYDPTSKKAPKGKSYIYSSKIDFNGKAHDHDVVYFNRSGYAYDHVTKTKKKVV